MWLRVCGQSVIESALQDDQHSPIFVFLACTGCVTFCFSHLHRMFLKKKTHYSYLICRVNLGLYRSFPLATVYFRALFQIFYKMWYKCAVHHHTRGKLSQKSPCTLTVAPRTARRHTSGNWYRYIYMYACIFFVAIISCVPGTLTGLAVRRGTSTSWLRFYRLSTL